MITKSFRTFNIKGLRAWDDRKAPAFSDIGKNATGSLKRVRTGYAACIGNRDAYNDILLPGAFAKAVAEFKAGQSRAKFLYNHDFQSVPTAKIISIEELGQADLPLRLKMDGMTSGVTGALKVIREYLPNARATEVLQAVDSCGLEMSFGFNLLPGDFEFAEINGQQVRLIKSVVLMDLSDVLYGANSSTYALDADAPKKYAAGSISKHDYLSEARLKMQKLKLLSAGIAV